MTRMEKLERLAAYGATDGERTAAMAAIDRIVTRQRTVNARVRASYGPNTRMVGVTVDSYA